MKRSSLSPRERVRTRHAAFTLIELLTVIAIILILAGLILAVAGNANYKGSVARANAEIQAMSTALENYKTDNGSYPRPTSTRAGNDSDALNPQSDTDPGGAAASRYQAAGKLLYQALSGTPASGGANNKRYLDFKQSQLFDAGGTSLSPTITPGPNTLVVDPFGLIYGYSTAAAYQTDNATQTGGTAPTGIGYNPTFDLWSTAGYGTGGKPYPNNSTGTACAVFWAKNW